MSQENEQTVESHQTTAHKKQPGILKYTIIVGIILLGLFYFLLSSNSSNSDISAVSSRSGQDLAVMSCDEFMELNNASQLEAVRKIYSDYKLPISEDDIKEQKGNVISSCRKYEGNKLMTKYIRAYLDIIKVPR